MLTVHWWNDAGVTSVVVHSVKEGHAITPAPGAVVEWRNGDIVGWRIYPDNWQPQHEVN